MMIDLSIAQVEFLKKLVYESNAYNNCDKIPCDLAFIFQEALGDEMERLMDESKKEA